MYFQKYRFPFRKINRLNSKMFENDACEEKWATNGSVLKIHGLNSVEKSYFLFISRFLTEAILTIIYDS
jgi:hypothetical protein